MGYGKLLLKMFKSLSAKGGGRVQIMENELECRGDKKGHDSHLAKKCLKKYYS